MSTNGTYVLTSNGLVYLRRESIVLRRNEKIALGQAPDEITEFVMFEFE